MEDSYVSYNALDDVNQDDSAAIVKAASEKRQAGKSPLTKKRQQQAPAETIDDIVAAAQKKSSKKAKPRAKAKPASKATPKSAAKRKAKAKTTPKKRKAKTPAKSIMPSMGLITRGVHAGMRGIEGVGTGVRGLSLSAWTGIAAVLMFMTVTVLSWTKAPQPPHLPLSWSSFQLHAEDGLDLPRKIWRDYVTKYPAIKSWAVTNKHGKAIYFKNPSHEELSDFAEYLESQSTIAEVNDITLTYIDKKGELQRSLAINVDLRTPEMPVILNNGQKAWVDLEGVLLPGLMPVPQGYEDRPVIRGIEEHRLALQEVLSFWQDLEDVIEPDLITDIQLNGVLQRSTNGQVTQRGIVLVTKPGTRIHWGRPGDEQFGLTPADKIRNLVRTLKSQGDLQNTEIIDVRHSEPKYVLAHGS